MRKKKKGRKNKKYGRLFMVSFFAVLMLGIFVIFLFKFIAVKNDAARLESQEKTDSDVVKNIKDESNASNENQLLDNQLPTDNQLVSNNQISSKKDEYVGKYAELLSNPEKMKRENAYYKEAKSDEEVVLGFGGDICFYDEFANMVSFKNRNSLIENCISPELLLEMRSADIFMVNNEFTYTNRGEPIPEKAYTFRSKPENAQILKDMGVDIVSLANNHAYDYGEISLLDSLDTLREIEMPYVGAGENIERASSPVYFVSNNMKIAYISATQIERLDNPDTKGATNTQAGVFRCFDVSALLDSVKKAKENSDFVVVYIHWGTENTDVLDWAQTDQALKIAEAGADLIVGDHPHCLQGIDSVNGVPVFYSLGNFWFNSKEVDTAMLKVTIDESGIKQYQVIPAKQIDCSTLYLDGVEKERVLQKIRELSPNVVIDQQGIVSY